MRNKKGFTLIELLAVIVILAILMVAAGAAVISTMNNAKINTFKDEALQAIDSAKMMYTDISMESNSNYIINSSDNTYKAMCVTLKGLVDNGYMEKDLDNNRIRGFVMVQVPINEGETKYTITLTDGTYGIDGLGKDKISGLKIVKDQSDGGSNSMRIITNINQDYPATGITTTDNNGAQSIDKEIDAIMNDKVKLMYTASNFYGGTNKTYYNVKCINSQI